MVWKSSGSLKVLAPFLTRKSVPSTPDVRSHKAADETAAVLQCPIGDCTVHIKASAYSAMDPSRDSHVMKCVERDHIFAAIFTSSGCAPGLSYLRIKLHQQMQAQIRLQKGAIEAVTASFAAINAAYRRLHPFHGDVFEGVSLTMVYIDAVSKVIHIASCGSCQAAACSLQDGKAVLVSSQPDASPSTSAHFSLSDVQSFPFDDRVDGLVLGSSGLWQEVAPRKALLRLQHLLTDTPWATDRNPAAHLTNYAKHMVTARMSSSTDPRMRALSSVSALESLWVGSRDSYATQERMPLRRRRGDVHGDLTAIMICLEWPGKRQRLEASFPGCRLYKTVSAPLMGSHGPTHVPVVRPTAVARWALLRMHFITFPRASKQLNLQRWHDTVAAAQAAAVAARRDQQLRELAAEALLFGSPVKVADKIQNSAAADIRALAFDASQWLSAVQASA